MKSVCDVKHDKNVFFNLFTESLNFTKNQIVSLCKCHKFHVFSFKDNLYYFVICYLNPSCIYSAYLYIFQYNLSILYLTHYSV